MCAAARGVQGMPPGRLCAHSGMGDLTPLGRQARVPLRPGQRAPGLALQGAAALLLRFGAIHTCPVPPAIPAAILAAMPPEQAARSLASRQEALRRAGNSVGGAWAGTGAGRVAALLQLLAPWRGPADRHSGPGSNAVLCAPPRLAAQTRALPGTPALRPGAAPSPDRAVSGAHAAAGDPGHRGAPPLIPARASAPQALPGSLLGGLAGGRCSVGLGLGLGLAQVCHWPPSSLILVPRTALRRARTAASVQLASPPPRVRELDCYASPAGPHRG